MLTATGTQRPPHRGERTHRRERRTDVLGDTARGVKGLHIFEAAPRDGPSLGLHRELRSRPIRHWTATTERRDRQHNQ